jgi:hypothetical protein
MIYQDLSTLQVSSIATLDSCIRRNDGKDVRNCRQHLLQVHWDLANYKPRNGNQSDTSVLRMQESAPEIEASVYVLREMIYQLTLSSSPPLHAGSGFLPPQEQQQGRTFYIVSGIASSRMPRYHETETHHATDLHSRAGGNLDLNQHQAAPEQ